MVTHDPVGPRGCDMGSPWVIPACRGQMPHYFKTVGVWAQGEYLDFFFFPLHSWNNSWTFLFCALQMGGRLNRVAINFPLCFVDQWRVWAVLLSLALQPYGRFAVTDCIIPFYNLSRLCWVLTPRSLSSISLVSSFRWQPYRARSTGIRWTFTLFVRR